MAGLAGGRPIIKLSSNENPFGPSPLALEAAANELAGLNFYPPRNDASLREALAAYHGNGLGPENFFSANGGVDAISLVEDAFLARGQRAIVSPPCFGAYISSLKEKGAVVDKVPLKEGSFDIDVDAILQAVTDNTRLVYLCNPNNPTGTYFGEDVLTAILDGLPDQVCLIYDEVYYHFATQFDLPDVQKHVRDGRNIAVIHSFSKAYGLAGLRIGYGIAPVDIVVRIEAKKRSFHLHSVGMSAAIAALNDHDHLNLTVRNTIVQRPKLVAGLEYLGLAVAPSQANFVMFRCPEGRTAEEITAALVKYGVMVRPAFHLPTHIRVTVGKPGDNEQFLSTLAILV
ncbi:MAG: aminotransferase class I/II-fold pyridoxal phosphate-dependent enzyme [Betaproteobacteria bacterium]|nr:aminotransferase class I/II-fold pyridoxal phosphate-dependent enzyme [Betaproteobacteria bacterium]